jgi:hypothetical protein
MARLMDDLEIGELSKRVRIEKQTFASNGAGGQTQTWSLRDVVWASITPLSYRETVQTSALQTTLDTAITIYYRTDIAITDRVQHMGRTFQVCSYQDPTGGQIVLRLLCQEVQA